MAVISSCTVTILKVAPQSRETFYQQHIFGREPSPADQRAHEHQPLRDQEERGGEHAGRGSVHGQRHPAQSGAGAGHVLPVLRHPHRAHQHLPLLPGDDWDSPYHHCSFEPERHRKATPPEYTQQRCHSSHLHHSHPQHLHHSLWGAEDWPLPHQEFWTLLIHGAMDSGSEQCSWKESSPPRFH